MGAAVMEKNEGTKYADGLQSYVWMKADMFKQAIAKNDLSYKDIAELLGLRSLGNVYNWCKGTIRISPKHLKMLSDYFGISEDDLIDHERNKKEPVKTKGGNHKTINPKTKIEVIMEGPEMDISKREPIPEKVVIPELIELRERPIPVNAEQIFCKNVKFYLADRGINQAAFEKKIVGPESGGGYLDHVIAHGPKIPLNIACQIARELDMSIEELVTDNTALKVEREIEEYERRIRELKRKIGMT